MHDGASAKEIFKLDPEQIIAFLLSLPKVLICCLIFVLVNFILLVNPLVEYEFHLIGFGIDLVLLIGTYIFARKKHKEVIYLL